MRQGSINFWNLDFEAPGPTFGSRLRQHVALGKGVLGTDVPLSFETVMSFETVTPAVKTAVALAVKTAVQINRRTGRQDSRPDQPSHWPSRFDGCPDNSQFAVETTGDPSRFGPSRNPIHSLTIVLA